MKIEKSFNVQIWVGLRKEYSQQFATLENVYSTMELICRDGDCVTVTPTRFIYRDGWEDGVVIGYINYPRFPSTPKELIEKSLRVGEILRKRFSQIRVSVTTPDKTYMLEND